MAQIALPRHQATQSQSVGIGAPLYQRRQHSTAGPVELLPNPDFSFPMRASDDPSSEPQTSSRPMSLQAYPTGRRQSMPHQRQKSVSALPAFSFNPAGAARPQTPPSPQRSPNMLPASPSKPIHGHRRGGSEFIGGSSTLMSSSPTKGDDLLPTPNNTLRPGPPAGRRGHAHRRSGAISSHDLTTIMNPPAPSKTGSAPNTPAEGNQFAFRHSVNRSMSQPSLRDTNTDNEADVRPPSRARVGFADKVEYIRPLSTISSETETSLSTFRGHSATNSLSSIVGGSSPQLARVGRPALSPVEDESRPSTAGAILDGFMTSPMSQGPVDRKRPMSAISPISPTAPVAPGPVKRRGFFRLESRRSDNAVNTLPTSVSDSALSKSLETPLASPNADEEPSETSEKVKTASRKSNRKPRKVKSWANSILPRKSKSSKKSKARVPTPPVGSISDDEDTDTSDDLDFVPNFDEDTTVTIVSPTETTPPELKVDTSYASWQPRQLKRVDSDIMSPIIDLDAALGPFQTPNGSSPRTHQRGFSANRRVLHSASGLAPSHRRTESAPELVPFEFRPSTATKATPMADVFEEEEPEDDFVMSDKDSKPSSIVEETPEPKISVVEVDDKQPGTGINWNFNDGLGIQRNNVSEVDYSEPLSPRSRPAYQSTDAELQQSPGLDPVEVVEDFEEPRTSSLTHSSDATITPQPTAEEVKAHSPAINLSLPLTQQNAMTPDTVTSSCPSPGYSFETPRAGTSTSSMTDYPNMPSPRFGEPGPELRSSVDDVPSLTSSRSTMTIAAQNAFPLPSPRRLGDRTASLCSDPSELESRRRKRSSIVSLSRLINSSSHSERSKLSIEQRPQSEHLEPAREKKKNNRLSKLKFWKSSKDIPTARS
ncbi:hypothetical protein NX059_001081 [Plenodomus lindquistii]|nr:hypothetical protein NX059_001081 [Plenodomus lindquistii]